MAHAILPVAAVPVDPAPRPTWHFLLTGSRG